MASVSSVALSNNKKRKQIYTRGYWQSIEVKKCFLNFISTDPEDTTGPVPMTHVYWYRFGTNWPSNNSRNTYKACWELIRQDWPAGGTGANNRIGDKINCKGLRIKGWIEVQDCLVTPCNLKLTILQLYNHRDVIQPNRFDIFWKWGVDNNQATAKGSIENMRINYYTMCRASDAVGEGLDFKINTVWKTTIQPGGHTANGMDTPLPSTNTATTNASWEFRITKPLSNQVSYNIPIDIVVDLNQTMDCKEDAIFFFWTCDYPYTSTGTIGIADLYPTPQFATADSYGFKINYYNLLYYTDP